MEVLRRLFNSQILWPDGIFITKHPKRQRPPSTSSPMSPSNGQPPVQSVPRKDDQNFDELQRQEADQRARLVYELMIGMIVHIC